MAFGLGRGLESLIPTKTSKPAKPLPSAPVRTTRASVGVTTEVALVDLVPNPRQPRKSFSLPELEELADSIKMHGIIEPLVVSPGSTAGQFVLVAGERRLRAAELAGLAKVPVVVRETDDREKLELSLIENIQRQDLNPLEEARALKQLLHDFKLSQDEVAKRVGRSRPAVGNILRLLDLAPECQRALLDGRISAGHARAMLACPGHAEQNVLLAQVEELHLSVRQVERLANQTARAAGVAKKGGRPARTAITDPAAARLERDLSRHLGTRVQVVSAPNGGRIVVEYYSTEERDRIADAMLNANNKRASVSAQEFSV